MYSDRCSAIKPAICSVIFWYMLWSIYWCVLWCILAFVMHLYYNMFQNLCGVRVLFHSFWCAFWHAFLSLWADSKAGHAFWHSATRTTLQHRPKARSMSNCSQAAARGAGEGQRRTRKRKEGRGRGKGRKANHQIERPSPNSWGKKHFWCSDRPLQRRHRVVASLGRTFVQKWSAVFFGAADSWCNRDWMLQCFRFWLRPMIRRVNDSWRIQMLKALIPFPASLFCADVGGLISLQAVFGGRSPHWGPRKTEASDHSRANPQSLDLRAVSQKVDPVGSQRL